MTREITHMKAFTAALESMGKTAVLDRPHSAHAGVGLAVLQRFDRNRRSRRTGRARTVERGRRLGAGAAPAFQELQSELAGTRTPPSGGEQRGGKRRGRPRGRTVAANPHRRRKRLTALDIQKGIDNHVSTKRTLDRRTSGSAARRESARGRTPENGERRESAQAARGIREASAADADAGGTAESGFRAAGIRSRSQALPRDAWA